MVTLTYYMMFENIHDPHARTRALCEFGSQVTIDKSVAPKQYFRSGLEMLRMAAVYHEEGNLEPAFILYSKFITLFVEKLPAHPLYKSSEAAVVADNKKKLKLVFPIAEKLKKNLTEQYVVEENKRVTAEKKRQAELAEEKRRLEEIKEKQRIEEQAQADKLKQEAEERWLRAQEERPSTPPSVDRSTKPSINHLTSIGSTDSSIYGLRTMMVPSQLSEKFLEIARANTAANIETCGILAGKLRQNNFHITHVLVPKQTGTSDTCTTLKEEELFDYIDSHDLITFGWIHTHPSQTAFLSSVDLHTHCSYQIMMPEAIAIVCSPKYNETGIFMLTPERGLPLISSCKEAGFHVHPKEPPLFQTCDHVQLVDDPNVIVADLRNI
ncbi:STAM-binding protein isoform X3 [Octopus bimaculoides]|uniref:MPN domain-containing protein n=2 Tax=Octopus bimaculoides TaxID=37653 RepID=A0A0L8GRS4_OCTBM|nr:STAM-binding protein isoform X3 [Octopus bimaculoides]|eukprot:XP_014778912.1 PREDICTED: STAM-binding protein-like isoform X3 [Octopus bimaculoides]